MGFDWRYGLLGVGAMVLGTYIRAWRFRLLLVTENVSTNRLCMVQNAGIGLNNLAPLRAISEPFQLALLTLKDKLNGGAVLGALVLERIIDMGITAGLLLVGITFMPAAAFLRTPAIGVGGVAAAGMIFLLFVLPRGVNRWGSRWRWLSSLAQALEALTVRPGSLFAALGITVVFWLVTGAGAWSVSLGLGLDVPFVVATAAFIAALFAIMMPSLPGGFGTFEFAAASLIGLVGIEGGAALSFALLTHLAYILPPIIIAAIVVSAEREALGGWRRIIR